MVNHIGTIVILFGIIIGGLITVIGWILVRSFRIREKKEDKLVEVTEKLTMSQQKLDNTTVRLSENIMAQVEICKLKHIPIDRRLDSHSRDIDSNIEKLHRLETRLIKANGN